MARRVARAAAVLLAFCVTGCAAPGTPAATPPAARPPAATVSPASRPTETPSPAPVATPSEEDTCIASTMATMSMQQLVGQLMMVGTPLTDPTGITSTVTRYEAGGVFLSGRSKAPAAELRSAIAAIQAAAPPGVRLLVALDQEGGEVQTLQGADFPPIPTAVDQGRLSQSELRSQALDWAGRLQAIGVSLDLAPVADTVPASVGAGNPPIGAYDRQYGSDPAAVATDIATVVTALQSTGVLATLKHFPGLGRVQTNTDTSTGAVDALTTSDDPFLAPFSAGIGAGTGAVMVSSASYPQLDPHDIAAFSEPIVTGLLRDRLGFAGIVVSDDLGAAGAVSGVPVGQRAVRFVAAGGDLVLTVAPATAAAMIDGMVAEATVSPVFAGKVRSAAEHVLRTKYGAGLLACSPRP